MFFGLTYTWTSSCILDRFQYTFVCPTLRIAYCHFLQFSAWKHFTFRYWRPKRGISKRKCWRVFFGQLSLPAILFFISFAFYECLKDTVRKRLTHEEFLFLYGEWIWTEKGKKMACHMLIRLTNINLEMWSNTAYMINIRNITTILIAMHTCVID